jgi:hypothetical protein
VIPARSYRASRTGRLVAGSFVYQWTRVNLPTLTLLEEAAGLRLIPRRPWFFQAIGVAAVLAALASMLWGPLVLGFVALSFAATLFAPGAALLALPALLIWAPRLVLGDSGGEAVFLRLDQFVVAGLVARGLFHPAERLTSPPAHTAYILFLATLALSVVLGLFQGTLAAPMSALLYLAQWLEFYGLYVVAWNFGPRIQRFFPYAWALPLVALAAYGLAECAWPFHEDPNVRYRTFERALFPGQANHAAGLFALATATGLGMALNLRYRALGLALALLSTLALWPTGSRSGALAWAAGIGAFTLITVPTLRWWASPLLVLGLAAVPGSFWAARSAPGSSMHDRLVAWKSALSTVDLYPLLGLGAAPLLLRQSLPHDPRGIGARGDGVATGPAPRPRPRAGPRIEEPPGLAGHRCPRGPGRPHGARPGHGHLCRHHDRWAPVLVSWHCTFQARGEPMSPGIPPSLDRQDQRVALFVGAIILAAMFVATLVVVVGRTAGGPVTEGGPPVSRLDRYLAEEERASAYTVVRDQLDQMKDEPGITAVFCRDCSHRWIGGEIEFRGQVDFQKDEGGMERHDYTARLSGSRQDGWEVLSVELVAAEVP